jgi:hypothetical protein
MRDRPTDTSHTKDEISMHEERHTHFHTVDLLQELFSDCEIRREKIPGFTKAYVTFGL